MERIEELRIIPLAYELGAKKSYGSARGRVTARTTNLIELRTQSGVLGIGEAWGPAALARASFDLIRPFYLGRDVFDHELVWPEIQARLYHFGIQNTIVACMSGIDMAAKDAAGKLLQLPLCKLIGGQARSRVPVYASGGYATDDPENPLARQLERMAATSIKAAKIKIGMGPKLDRERTRLAREVLGSEWAIMVDANGNYTPDAALASMRALEPLDISLYEEPLPPTDFSGYAFLRSRANIPIATGEALYTMFDFARLMQPPVCDIVQPDLSLCGGFREARAIATLAQLHNLRISPHVWTSAIGLAAGLHFVASLTAFPHSDFDVPPTILEYDVGENGLRDHLLTGPLIAKDGFLTVPEGPGLGIDIDPDAVKRFSVA